MQEINQHQWRIASYILLGMLLMWFSSLWAQKGRISAIHDFVPTIQDNRLEFITEDTCTVKNLFLSYIQPELFNGVYLNLDTVRKYTYQGLAISRRINYERGIIVMQNCLRSAFTFKGPQDSAQFYLRINIKEAEQDSDTWRLFFLYTQYARSFWKDSKYDSAIYMTKKAVEFAVLMNDSSGILSAKGFLPRNYLAKGDYENGARACLENIELAKAYRDTFELAWNYHFLGGIYGRMKLFEKELEVTRNAIHLTDNFKGKFARFWVYYLACNTYLNQEKYDSVIYYARKDVQLFNRTEGQNVSDISLGTTYLKLGQIDSARFYFNRYVNESFRCSLPVGPEAYAGLGSCEYETGNFEKAIYYYNKAEGEIKDQDISNYRVIYKSLYECYDTLQQFKKALLYLSRFNTVEESLLMSQKAFSIAVSENESRSKMLEDQIHWLSQNSQLKDALANKQKDQKTMVYGISGFLLVLIFLGFIRFAKQKEIKNKQNLLNERLRISRELHDEVGATLSGIAMYSHVAKDQLTHEKHEEAKSSLSYMQKSAGEMVNKLSDIVWLINPEQDTILEIIGRLGEYGKQMAGAKNMQMKLDVPSELTGLHIPLDARRNIYLICKEAINNAVKYSHGRFVELQVRIEGLQLSFSVIDDGNGFDMDTIKQGNGIVNMRKRAADIGATFHLESIAYHGTKIEVNYKLIH